MSMARLLQSVVYLILFLAKAAMAVEEAPYRILVSESLFEERQYPIFVVAETEFQAAGGCTL